jgi:protein-S-isoprenylcysteine O-methyltransferase Ste14
MHRGYHGGACSRSLPEASFISGFDAVAPAGGVMAQKLRVPLGFVLAAVALYLAEPSLVSILVGLPVALVGAVFRALAAGVIKKDSTLATSGVYALTRNPLYFGSSLLATGFAIMSANEIAAAVIIVPFGLIYPTVMLREEAHLTRLFPEEFRSYKAKVPRFFPRVTLRFPRSFSFNQYISNREYNTALGLVGAVSLLAVKYWLG